VHWTSLEMFMFILSACSELASRMQAAFSSELVVVGFNDGLVSNNEGMTARVGSKTTPVLASGSMVDRSRSYPQSLWNGLSDH